jgi:hypothetical protein
MERDEMTFVVGVSMRMLVTNARQEYNIVSLVVT